MATAGGADSLRRSSDASGASGEDGVASLLRGSPLALVDESVQQAFDRYTRVLARVLDVPVVLLSLVDEGVQYVVSQVGLGDSAVPRRSSLDASFCRYVVDGSAPYSTADATGDPLSSRALPGMDVGAYTGAPVLGPTGAVVGTLCAIDRAPRAWSEDDIALLDDLAAAAGSQLTLRLHDLMIRDEALLLGHRMRSGLTALRLEVAELAEGAADDVQRQAVSRLSRLLEQQSDLASAGVRVDRQAHAPGSEQQLSSLLELVVRRTADAAADAGRQVVVAPVTDIPVRADVRALCRVLEGMVLVRLRHGKGPLTVATTVERGFIRFHLSDEGDVLPPEVAHALTGRRDNVGGPLSAGEVSLAEEAARSFGGRLVLPVGDRSAVDLLLPV